VTPEQLAARIGGCAVGAGRPAVVALDGPSGSGKTTLARSLLGLLPDAACVHLDDLYPGWDGLDAAVPLLVGDVLAPLTGAEPIVVASWGWTMDAPGPPRPRPDLGPPRPSVVLVEGAGAGALACAPYLAALLWLEAADAVRRDRALARDGDTYGPHWERWARQERAHFGRERTRERADLVLESATDGLVVVREGAVHSN
jgi:energy-coupling factor transporter ATP-binding protein EcfA2